MLYERQSEYALNTAEVSIMRDQRTVKHYGCGGYPCVRYFEFASNSSGLTTQVGGNTNKFFGGPDHIESSQMCL